MGRRKERIHSYFYCILQHVWDDVHQNRTVELQTWVCVDLDQPRFELVVDHEVETEDFEVVSFPIFIEHASRSSHAILGNQLHLRVDGFVETVSPIILSLQVLLELII